LNNVIEACKIAKIQVFYFVKKIIISNFARNFSYMKKAFFLPIIAILLLTGCATEYNSVYKIPDTSYRYEYAKELFARGKYVQASTLLSELIISQKGTDNAQESLYMLGMAQYCSRNYEEASATFKRYMQTYPRSIYSENASYYVGQSLYMSTPEARLDQSQTYLAIAAFQEYLDLYPNGKMKTVAQNRLFELQDKLVMKELYSAELYYNLGTYFGNCTNGGNNYEACIITAQNALKEYPYTSMREDFALLIMKSKYELAEMSVEEKKLERFQDAEDECYGFLNEYPDSKDRELAEKYIEKCKRFTSTQTNS